MLTIKSYRLRHKLTLAQLGERVGVTRATIWKYENGTVPPPAVAVAISQATGGEVTLAHLCPEIFGAVRAEIEAVST